MRNLFKNNLGSQRGVTMIEYALLLALIAVVSIAIITTLGTDIRSIFTSASNAIGSH